MSRRSVKKIRYLDGDIVPLYAWVVNSTDSTGGAAPVGATGVPQLEQRVAPAGISRPHLVQKGIVTTKDKEWAHLDNNVARAGVDGGCEVRQHRRARDYTLLI